MSKAIITIVHGGRTFFFSKEAFEHMPCKVIGFYFDDAGFPQQILRGSIYGIAIEKWLTKVCEGIKPNDRKTRLICAHCGACADHPEDRDAGGCCHHCGAQSIHMQERTLSGEWVTTGAK